LLKKQKERKTIKEKKDILWLHSLFLSPLPFNNGFYSSGFNEIFLTLKEEVLTSHSGGI